MNSCLTVEHVTDLADQSRVLLPICSFWRVRLPPKTLSQKVSPFRCLRSHARKLIHISGLSRTWLDAVCGLATFEQGEGTRLSSSGHLHSQGKEGPRVLKFWLKLIGPVRHSPKQPDNLTDLQDTALGQWQDHAGDANK